MKSIIRNFIAKRVAGRSDDGIMITLTDPKKVDFQAAMMEDLLMRNGIDPNAIQSEEQLKMILNRISSMENQTTSGIRNTESAKVFDLKGKRIKDTDNIMGGEEMPPPGSRGGPDDIAAPVQSAEETLKNMTEAEIKANLEAQNKSAIEKILKRKNREDVYGLEDYDTTNMSEIKKEIIRTETKLGNLNPNTPGFRERAKPLIDKITALQKKLRDDKAYGGRIGYSIGDLVMPDNDFMNLELPEDDDPYADIQGQTALLDPFTVIGGLIKVGQGAKASALAKEFFRNKARQEAGKKIYKEIQKKVNPPKYGPPTPNIKPGRQISGGGREVSTNMGSVAGAQQDISNYQSFNEVPLRTGGRVGLKDGFPSREENLKLLKEELKEIFKKQTDPFPKPGSNQFKDFKLKLENILSKSRLKSADGGIMRIGLKEGSGMTRRTFLKFLAGAASIPIVGKILKPFKIGKTVTKVPIIKTDNVPGKPEWFDQLVNKVIIEGDDVTKQFATKEREIVHVKTLEKGSNRIDPNTGEIVKPGTPLSDDVTVKVTQDLDEGAVRVEYQSPENVYGDPVQLRYKKPNPDEGDPSPSAEFDTAESGPVGRAFGPDDYEIEIDELGGTSISDLTSDVSKLK